LIFKSRENPFNFVSAANRLSTPSKKIYFTPVPEQFENDAPEYIKKFTLSEKNKTQPQTPDTVLAKKRIQHIM
jgi:hypothetical protein